MAVTFVACVVLLRQHFVHEQEIPKWVQDAFKEETFVRYAVSADGTNWVENVVPASFLGIRLTNGPMPRFVNIISVGSNTINSWTH